MKKLFVLGDSFSWPYETNKLLWPVVISKKLEQRLGEKIEIDNRSLIGASQDYVWKNLSDVIEIITPDDFLIIILTSAERFWFFENRPEYSNMLTIENVRQMTEDTNLQNIILGFVTRIWRPTLAEQLQNHRLGYLSYHILKKKLRKPLVLKAFEQYNLDHSVFPELILSKHYLSAIQLREFEKFDGKNTSSDILMDPKYWHHVDCRYNHLCMSNHAVLGNILHQSLLDGNSPDLDSNQFHRAIITESNCRDKDFASEEFCLRYFNEMMSNSVRQKLGAKSFRLFF